MLTRVILRVFAHWLPLAVAITGICGLVYLAVQQNYRQSANDPQIQMAEDIAASFNQGQSPQIYDRPFKQDLAKTLAPYFIIYDDAGQQIASSVLLDGAKPVIPSGVFDYVRNHGEDRFTWQPRSGVRSAVVVTQYSGKSSGFIVVGRSMREVESRIDRLSLEVLAAWGTILIATFIAAIVLTPFTKHS